MKSERIERAYVSLPYAGVFILISQTWSLQHFMLIFPIHISVTIVDAVARPRSHFSKQLITLSSAFVYYDEAREARNKRRRRYDIHNKRHHVEHKRLNKTLQTCNHFRCHTKRRKQEKLGEWRTEDDVDDAMVMDGPIYRFSEENGSPSRKPTNRKK